ncbi:MAG: glycogen/starch synthase [Paludibacteraceae bacterium]|nr:glycogen/starch synthase [Paludibacteraceae bacterium]
MAAKKILYIAQEIMPYVPENEISKLCRQLPQAIQDRKNEVRLFMPRYGHINERKNQLHEVIRLSGANIAINDTDHPLILKVASIAAAHMQVYFIDNDDLFSRKGVIGESNGEEFEDCDERMIFYIRGVISTVKKLGWKPDVVHCVGWMSALTPYFVKKAFADDEFFADVKVVTSVCKDDFKQTFADGFRSKCAIDELSDDDLALVPDSAVNYEALMKFALDFSDAAVIAQPDCDPAIVDYAENKFGNVPVIEFADGYADKYNEFYESLF